MKDPSLLILTSFSPFYICNVLLTRFPPSGLFSLYEHRAKTVMYAIHNSTTFKQTRLDFANGTIYIWPSVGSTPVEK